VLLAVFGVIAGGWGIVEAFDRPNSIMGMTWQYWMMVASAVVAPLVQAGVLWALLSIDERLEKRS
jgi:hypothetical protein